VVSKQLLDAGVAGTTAMAARSSARRLLLVPALLLVDLTWVATAPGRRRCSGSA
jgi:hypothetical protein